MGPESSGVPSVMTSPVFSHWATRVSAYKQTHTYRGFVLPSLSLSLKFSLLFWKKYLIHLFVTEQLTFSTFLFFSVAIIYTLGHGERKNDSRSTCSISNNGREGPNGGTLLAFKRSDRLVSQCAEKPEKKASRKGGTSQYPSLDTRGQVRVWSMATLAQIAQC